MWRRGGYVVPRSRVSQSGLPTSAGRARVDDERAVSRGEPTRPTVCDMVGCWAAKLLCHRRNKRRPLGRLPDSCFDAIGLSAKLLGIVGR